MSNPAAVSASPTVPMVERVGFLLLFFLISFGLGYPVLNRYDPRVAPATSDARDYAAILEGGTDDSTLDSQRRYRVLVPLLARPVRQFATGRIGTWNPIQFAMLIVNALFCAGTALIITLIGARWIGPGAGAFAACLYLLSFNVANFQLAGLVDSLEFFAMALLLWFLITGRWLGLPFLAVAAAGKETFPIMATGLAGAWWLTELKSGAKSGATGRSWAFASVVGMFVSGLIVVMGVHYAVDGVWIWPWQIAGSVHSETSFFVGLVRCIFDRAMLFTFIFLLPLGLWRLSSFPRPWLIGAAVSSLLILAMGAWASAGGNVSRPLFGVLGPLLSLSAARLLLKK